MATPRKHVDIIKAWADGYEVEAYNPERDAWVSTPEPGWFENIEYRVKPGVIRAPRITEVYAQIELNPFSGEPELFNRENRCNVIMRFENDDLVFIDMVGDSDEEPAPW